MPFLRFQYGIIREYYSFIRENYAIFELICTLIIRIRIKSFFEMEPISFIIIMFVCLFILQQYKNALQHFKIIFKNEQS